MRSVLGIVFHLTFKAKFKAKKEQESDPLL